MSAISGSRADSRFDNWNLIDYVYVEVPFQSTMPIFDNSERSAMRALMACSALLIAAATASLVLTGLKSWLLRNGTRNKTRLGIFALCLALIIAARAVLIAELSARVQGTNRQTAIYNYDYLPFLLRHIFDRLLSWVADILIFCLVVLEITRSNASRQRKSTLFEWCSFAVIAILFVFALIHWALDTTQTMHGWGENYTFQMPWRAFFALRLTYAVLALLFAMVLLLATEMRPVSAKSGPRKHGILLLSLIVAFWVGQALNLAHAFVQAFSTSDSAYRVMLALQASAEFPYMAMVLLLALLGWDSYTFIRSNPLADESASKA